MNTLTYGGTTLVLSPDMQWRDEFAWEQVAQQPRYTITGALVLEAAAKLKGRPITLGGGPNFGLLPRATLLTLLAWRGLAGQTFSLVLRGEAARTVVFNHQAGAIEAAPFIDYANPVPTDLYSATLRFLEV